MTCISLPLSLPALRYASSDDGSYMTAEDVLNFVLTEQDNTEATLDYCKSVIERFEPSEAGQNHLLSLDGMLFPPTLSFSLSLSLSISLSLSLFLSLFLPLFLSLSSFLSSPPYPLFPIFPFFIYPSSHITRYLYRFLPVHSKR